MEHAYPDLRERAEFTLRLLAAEESKFRETLERGRAHLDEILARSARDAKESSRASRRFPLYDTYRLSRSS